MSTSRIADSVGRVLGDRYRLIRPLGSGASANVFAAEDVKLRRRVAVKVLHPALAGDDSFLRRFRREAQTVASLRHPNILRVYDWGDDGGSPFLVMELLDGGTLRSMLDRGALLSPAQAAAVGAGAARALDYAHRQGVVHRDIKPANLIFDDQETVCVADFGLARALAEAGWTEPNGAVVGTARYASPELVRGEQLDAKADVYSLALVLVESLTGRVPFASDTAFGSLMARVGRSIDIPPEAGPLAPVLAAAGAAEPGDRIDAATLVRQLDSIAAQLPYPAPLSLLGPSWSETVERDELSPTELPGRPRLFDAEVAPTVAPPSGAPPDAGVIDLRASPSPLPVTAISRRRRGRVLIAAFVGILLLAGAAAGWAWRSGVFKPEESVPGLVGLTQGAASAAVAAHHLSMVVASSVYDPHPAGTVISQSPSSGKLREGAQVKVVLSSGPAPVPVPALANDPLAAAEDVLSALGLKWVVVTETSLTVPAGSVIRSDPSSGTIVPGQSVTLVESTGKPTVAVPPITLGTETQADAQAALTAAGFKVTVAPQYSTTVKAGDVIAVTPPSGTSAPQGSAVTLTVSQGPHYVAVPPTRGYSVGRATEVLTADGFNVDGVQGSPIGTVSGTNPAAGTQVVYGSSIVIITN